MSALTHIPLWVLFLFLFLFFVRYAWKRTQTRVVPISRIAVMPLIFIYLSMRAVNALSVNGGWGLYLPGALLGLGLGYLLLKGRMVRADRSQSLIEIPGQYTLFVLMLAIFAIEFVVHFVQGAQLPLASSFAFNGAVALLEGVLAGTTLGRTLYYGYHYLQQPSCHLELTREPRRARSQ